MNRIFISDIIVADPRSKHFGKKLNVRIHDGVADFNVTEPDNTDFVVSGNGAYISPGWIDSMAFCGEPGEEWREDLISLTNAAAAGGFTQVAAFCGNHPVPDKASAIQSILKKAGGLKAQILPMGAATKNCAGSEMAEIFDLKQAGAVAICDGDKPLNHAGLKARIMEYASHINVPFIDIPMHTDLMANGTVHDGRSGNALGLKGIPSVAEYNAIQTTAEIAKWLNLPVRFTGISSAKSTSVIHQLKSEGLNIKSGVAVMNLLFSDEDLREFDENCKVLPPLRSVEDRQALIDALKDGILDMVYSNHVPQDSESKSVEFEYAAFGAITLQSALGMLILALKDELKPEMVAQWLSIGPAEFLNLPLPIIESGEPANYTLFSLEGSWVLNQQTSKSKSRNTPLWNSQIPGTVLGTIVSGTWQPNQTTASV